MNNSLTIAATRSRRTNAGILSRITAAMFGRQFSMAMLIAVAIGIFFGQAAGVSEPTIGLMAAVLMPWAIVWGARAIKEGGEAL